MDLISLLIINEIYIMNDGFRDENVRSFKM